MYEYQSEIDIKIRNITDTLISIQPLLTSIFYKNASWDYPQIFRLAIENDNQKIIHNQEFEYNCEVEYPINAIIFIFDEENSEFKSKKESMFKRAYVEVEILSDIKFFFFLGVGDEYEVICSAQDYLKLEVTL